MGRPALNLRETLEEDEQIRQRKMVIDLPLPTSKGQSVRQMANPIHMSESPCQYEHAGYPLGYHTREIVESLGLNYDELEKKGVFS